LKLGIIFGGNSYEHEISIVSAISLKKILFNLDIFIFLDTDRTLYLIPKDKMKAKTFSSGEYKKEKIVTLSNSKLLVGGGLFKPKEIQADIYINGIHGQDGEDGTFSSVLDFYNLNYIGPRVQASVVSYDKHLTKLYAKEMGVKTLDYVVIKKGEDISNIKLPFDYPVIIKPTTLGSSIGVNIVESANDLEYGLDIAYEFGNSVIIEPFIDGVKEYNLAGFRANDYYFSMVEEPQKAKFLDFEKKYMDFARTEQVFKAQISQDLEQKLKDNFINIYNTIFDGSLIRCDFFVVDDEVYLNEINPIPGSMANYLFEDFSMAIDLLTNYLPMQNRIDIKYQYIDAIHSAKGK